MQVGLQQFWVLVQTHAVWGLANGQHSNVPVQSYLFILSFLSSNNSFLYPGQLYKWPTAVIIRFN